MKRILCVSFARGACVVLAGAVVSGCAMLETPSDREMRMRRQQQMSMQVSRLNQTRDQQSRIVAGLRADVQALMEERQRVLGMVESARREAALVRQELQDLDRRLSLAERQLSKMDADYRQRLEGLQGTIARQEKARKEAIDQVIDTVSQEISATASKLQQEQRQLLKSVGGSEVQGEYVVQSGDTLGAIAQAFGVSLRSLKRANNLEGDLIRVGQKLVIPAQ